MSTADPVRTLIVDDHRLLAHALALTLRMEGVSARVADLRDRNDLLRDVRKEPPDLVLLDLDLGGVIGDGSTLVPPLVAAGCRVLVVSATADRDQVCRAVELGATGVVCKDAPFDELLDTILRAARGEAVLPACERRRMLGEIHAERYLRAQARVPFERLSHREAEVLRALAGGTSVTTLCTRWHVAESTVRSQVRGLLTKLDVCSQLEAVALAHRSGWLDGKAVT